MKYCPACNNKFDDNVSFCPKDGEVLEEDPTSFVGSVLDGQYQVEALLGKGGMGAVYSARHILLGDRVAIKLLPPEMRSNTEWLRRFQREGQAARRFRHPNAVTVYDLRTSSDGTIYLVMEYVEGTTLDVELKRHGTFSPAEALTTLKPVMSVLNAAHAMGVVHRDLKPENIMIGKPSTGGEPVVKLLDLGIAKLREVAGAEKTGNTNLTIAGQMLGTPYYMSPEQWGELPKDGSSEIDGRADIYSLGVVLYEIIAGHRPFNGVTLLELRLQHVSETPKPLDQVTANVPADFSKAIMRSIAKDRADRQATAGELETELTAALRGEVIAPSVGPGPATGFETIVERATPTVGGAPAMTEVVRAPVQTAERGEAATIPTVVVSEESLAARAAAAGKSAEAVPAIAKQQVEISIPARRSPLLLVSAVVLILLLVVGVGGYALMHFMGKRSAAGNSNSPTGSDLSVPMHEVARYWLQVDTPNSADAIRAGDTVTMQSGQSFKFHFSPNESGYLYIVGPGEKNVPTTFLTSYPRNHPDLASGVNSVASGVDFIFPADSADKANWITLDRTSGTDEFTIIFSPIRLNRPTFLTAEPGHKLSEAEQAELQNLQNELKANAGSGEVIKTGVSPQVAVRVPQNGPENASVIFRIRIEHR